MWTVSDLGQQPEFRSRFLRLIDEVFPKGSPVDGRVPVEQEFPLLLHESNATRNVFLTDGESIAAAASFRLFDLRVGGLSQTLRCAGIGLVVTDPLHQRQGLGHRLQAEIESRAKTEGALLTILWSDLVQFYTRLGYLITGTEMQWQLDRSELELLQRRLQSELRSTPWRLEALRDFSSVAHLYERAGIGPLRDPALYDALLRLPKTFGVAARDNKTGSVLAYAIMGKGRDLRDTVHEIAGDAKTLPYLLAELLPRCESGLRLYHPPASPLIREIEHWLGPATRSAMAFFKVVSGPKLIEWMRDSGVLPAGLGIVPLGNGFTLQNRHITFFESSDYGHLLQLFFGPWRVQEMEDLPPSISLNMSGVTAPLPLYFWGFDSV